MAVLGSTTLTGCLYIPDFIAATTTMIFENATAPTSWTKDITHNNKALRVINGTVTDGGSTGFTTVFASRAVQGSIAQNATGLTVNSAPALVAVGAAPAQVTSGATTLTLAQIPSHNHTYSINNIQNRTPGPDGLVVQGTDTPNTGQAGSSQSHTHAETNPNHPHPVTNPNHPHGVTDPQHNHTFTGTAQDFAVLYVDVIFANKD
jgi:hypothetical protein